MKVRVSVSNIEWDSRKRSLPAHIDELNFELDDDDLDCLQDAAEQAFLEYAADRYGYCIVSCSVQVQKY